MEALLRDGAREEYLSVINAVEIISYRLVEISLTNYTMTGNQTILRANIDKWQRDLMRARKIIHTRSPKTKAITILF